MERRVRWRVARRVGAVLVLFTGVAACSSGNGATPSASPETTAPSSEPSTTAASVVETTSSGAPGSEVDTSLLRGAGVVIGADEAATAEATGAFRMTELQARRLVADTAPADGVPGAELDALAPVPAGAPPMSFVLAAWISMGATPAALAAQDVMGEQDWTNAASVPFPMAVVAMFVADIAARFAGGTVGADDAAGDGHAATTVPGSSASSVQALRVPGAALGPCTAVTGFLTSVIGGLFDALRVAPPASGSNFLVSLVNGAITLAQALVQGLVDLALEPILAAIRVGVGALGVVSTMASLFKNETLTVTLEPGQSPDNYRFAIDGEAPKQGAFVARARELTSDWPAFVVDCAKAAGATLPRLLPAGAAAHWTVGNPFSVIQPGPLDTTVGDDLTTRLMFTTGSETMEQHDKGTELNERATVEVRVPRKEIDAFLQLAKDQVGAAEQALLAKVPAGPGRAAAQAAVKAAIDPTVNALSDQVSKEVGGVFALTGRSGVFVQHHAPPETTTTLVQGLEVTFDRPAIFPLEPGQVVDVISCTGLFGQWSGVIRNGGINGGGITIPFQDIPISFAFDGPDSHVAMTHSESDLATPRGTVHVVVDLVITIDESVVDDTTMSITGTGSASDGELTLSDFLGSVATGLPIGPAPAGAC